MACTGDCNDNCGGCTATKIITNQGEKGDQGVQGVQGIQGAQGIQGDVGPEYTPPVLTWVDLVLINGWSVSVGDVPQYATDGQFIYFRGRLSALNATAIAFTTLAPGVTKDISTAVGKIGATAIDFKSFVINFASGTFDILEFQASEIYSLDTITPVSLR